MNNNQTPEEILAAFTEALEEAVQALNDINNNLIDLNHLIAVRR